MKKIIIKKKINMQINQSIKSVFTLAIISTSLFISSCGNSDGEKTAEAPAAEEHTQATTEVSVTKEQYSALKIQLGSVEQKNLTSVLKATGFLKVPPQSKANI
ncbi:MAG: hypothetical protein ABI729_05365, partial [Chitinophagales bacterium]